MHCYQLYYIWFFLAFCLFSSANDWDCGQSLTSSDVEVATELSLTENTGSLHIKWEGSRSTDLVVVSLDSKEAKESRSVRLEPNSTGLFGIVLVRPVRETNSATLVYQHEDLIKYFEDDHIFITVYLASDMDILLMEGDPFVMGGEHVRGVVTITGEDIMPEFQFVCRDEDDVRLSNIVPTAVQLPAKITEGARCSATLSKTSIKAVAEVVSNN